MAPPFVSSIHFTSSQKIHPHKKRDRDVLIERCFVCFVSKLSDMMEEKDDQYLTDVLSYSAERLAKVKKASIIMMSSSSSSTRRVVVVFSTT